MKNINNLQEAILNGDVDRIVAIGDLNENIEGGICTAQAAIKIATAAKLHAEFWIDGVLFDGDMEETILEKNNFEYLNRKDLISWSDIVKITDDETNESIYVPIAEKEEFDSPDDYLMVELSAKSLEEIKDGRELYEHIAVISGASKLKWIFLEDKYPTWDEFKKYLTNNTTYVINNDLNEAFAKLSDEDICNMFEKYFAESKYSPEYKA